MCVFSACHGTTSCSRRYSLRRPEHLPCSSHSGGVTCKPVRCSIARSKWRDEQYRQRVCRSQPEVRPQTQISSGHHDKWKGHVLFCAMGLGIASVHRVTLAILAVTFQQELGFTLPQLGVLQSAMLWGYVIGQIPSGIISDKWGGSPVMTLSLLLWCSTNLAMAGVLFIPKELAFNYVLAIRVLLGFFQSGIITATAAMSARWVPEADRSKSMGFCYFLYSAGTFLGLWLTPIAAQPFGWPAALLLYALVGFAWAVYGWLGLAPESDAINFRIADPPSEHKFDEQLAEASQEIRQTHLHLSHRTKIQVAVLIWTHSAIGWGFTFLQNWIPTILSSMGMQDLNSIGLVACFPWVAASLVSLIGGFIADWLHRDLHWDLVKVRTFSQNCASLGPAIALFALGLFPHAPVNVAVVLLVAAAGMQAWSYAGFHSYAQDVASQDVGKLLGYTNTGGTALGVICNLVTGTLAGGQRGFSAVFFLCASIYFLSFITWNLFMKGEKVSLS